ncbi:hypothetical protein [Citrobacter arsenatis]|uniref:hypothetical protein n=1 Tax=Citrobacter arsenatis TaxID=2546350 RepID=UPI00300E3F50
MRCRALLLLLLSLPLVPAFAECNLTVSRGVIDYGLIYRKQIDSQSNTKEMPAMTVVANVVCDTPGKVALFAHTVGAAGSPFRFAENGTLAIEAANALQNGQTVSLSQVVPGGWSMGGGPTRERVTLLDGQGVTPVENGIPVAVSNFSVTFTITPTLDRRDLSSRDQTLLATDINFILEMAN